MNTGTNPGFSGRHQLYHRNQARIERVKTVFHLAPALVLLGSLQHLVSPGPRFGWLQALEVAVGAAYLVLMVRELRHLRRATAPHHARVAWLELAAAGILALEGYHIWHRHHEAEQATGQHRLHVLPWLYWAVALWYVAMAFGIARLYERRHLHLHPEGFGGRLQPLGRAFDFRWNEVRAVEAEGPAGVVVHRRDGRRHPLSFARVHDGPAHRDRLLAHAAEHLAGRE